MIKTSSFLSSNEFKCSACRHFLKGNLGRATNLGCVFKRLFQTSVQTDTIRYARFIAICYRREVSQLHSLYDNEMRHVTDDAKARKSHFVLFVYDHSLSCKCLQLTSRYTVLVSSSMTLQSGRTIKPTNASTSRDKPLSIQFDTQLHARS